MPRGIISRGELRATLDGVDFDTILNEYVASVAQVNQTRNALTGLFTTTTISPAEAVRQDGDFVDFEDASEFGRAKSAQVKIPNLMMGVPLRWYDLDIRFTEAFLRDARRADVDAQHTAALEAHNRLEFKATMRALLYKTTIATRPVNEQGVPIYSLYDGETDSQPPEFAGKTFAANHQHYLTTESTAPDGADLSVMINHVTEHGYGAEEGERILILVHPNQGNVIRGFRANVNASPFDFIPSEQAPAYLSTEFIIGKPVPSTYRGLDVIGSFGSALIVESYRVPAGYMIAAATGTGPRRAALTFRVHERPEFRGLRIIRGNGRYPLVESTYAAGFGAAVRNRGAAVVMQVTNSTTYSNPSL